MSADSQAAAKIFGGPNGCADLFQTLSLEDSCACSGRSFYFYCKHCTRPRRTRTCHRTGRDDACTLSFHFGPTFGPKERKRESFSSELSVAGRSSPAGLGVSRRHAGAPREQRMREVSSVAVAPWCKAPEAGGTQGSCCGAPGARSPLVSWAEHTWKQLRSPLLPALCSSCFR